MKFYPTVVTFELTNACNLRCKHCYIRAGEKLEKELSLDEIKETLKELRDIGTMEVEFSGGEPLLRPDLFKILDVAHSLDFEITIATNGILIDERIAKKFSDYSINYIQISLEGLKDAHEYIRGRGTFKRAIKAIKLLLDRDLRVAVRMTVTKKSLVDVSKVADLCVQLGVHKFGVMRFLPAGRGLLYRDELMLNANDIVRLHEIVNSVYKKYRNKIEMSTDPCGFFDEELIRRLRHSRSTLCPCGKTWCVIKPDGIVSPCEILNFYAGDVRRQKFSNIWENAQVFKMFREFNPKKLKGICGSCKFRDVCGGYCRALAVLHTGDFYSEDFTCYHVQKFHESRMHSEKLDMESAEIS